MKPGHSTPAPSNVKNKKVIKEVHPLVKAIAAIMNERAKHLKRGI